MSEYHDYLIRTGQITAVRGFEDAQPPNVVLANYSTPYTVQGGNGNCYQTVKTWVRTDITYKPDCEPVVVGRGVTRLYPRLPEYKPELAVEVARRRGIALGPTNRVVASESQGPQPGDSAARPASNDAPDAPPAGNQQPQQPTQPPQPAPTQPPEPQPEEPEPPPAEEPPPDGQPTPQLPRPNQN
jgi:hypothetical protein